METSRNCRRYAVQLRLLKLLGRGFSFSVSKFVYIFYANSSWQIIVVRINSQCRVRRASYLGLVHRSTPAGKVKLWLSVFH